MTHFVLIHGAFRGGWAWEPLSRELQARGHEVTAPTLTGCEAERPPDGATVTLDQWVDDVVHAVRGAGEPVVLVAHSQGGIPVRCAVESCADALEQVVYLDAAVPDHGERGVDLNPPGVPAPPNDLDPALSIPPRPVGAEQGFIDPQLTEFVNARLVSTPLGPSLDQAVLTDAGNGVPARFVFFTQTPATYPCQLTRSRLDERGIEYSTVDGPHDSPLTQPAAIAEILLGQR